MDIFDLAAKITLDTSEYEQGLAQAENSGSSFGGKIKTALGTAGKIGAAAIGAVTTATVAMTAGMVKGANEVADYGDNIDKMSQKMGLSAEAYQEWDAVMQHSGTSIESLQAGMKTLANAVEGGNKAFERLGMSQEDIASMSNEELFSATITALQNVDNETERTYLAGQLLGRGATELGALLNTSAEDTQAMKDRVHELGGVLSDDAVKSAARFKDSLQDMQTAFSGIKRGIQGEFLPGITDIMDGFTSLIAGEEGAEDAISQGIDRIFEAFNTVAGRVGEIASKLMPRFIDAVISELPALFSMASEMLMTITNGIIENLPVLVESALQVVLSLADGIAQNLPELIPTIVDVVIQIVETLVDNVDLLVEASVKIIVALAQGIMNALPRLISKAPEIIKSFANAIIQALPTILNSGVQLLTMFVKGIANALGKVRDIGKQIVDTIKNALTGVVSSALQWGKDLIENFKSGITSKVASLGSAVSGAAKVVKNFLGFSEPKEGPLSDFHTYAPDMMKLFAQGVTDNTKVVTDSISRAFDFDGMIGAPQGSATFAAQAGAAGAQGGPITIVVRNILDGKQISETVTRYQKNAAIAYGR